jgi:hypothetical protein
VRTFRWDAHTSGGISQVMTDDLLQDIVDYLKHHDGNPAKKIDKPMRSIPKEKDYNLEHIGVSAWDAAFIRRRLVGNGRPLHELMYDLHLPPCHWVFSTIGKVPIVPFILGTTSVLSCQSCSPLSRLTQACGQLLGHS